MKLGGGTGGHIGDPGFPVSIVGAQGPLMVREMPCEVPETSWPQKSPGVKSDTSARSLLQNSRVRWGACPLLYAQTTSAS